MTDSKTDWTLDIVGIPIIIVNESHCFRKKQNGHRYLAYHPIYKSMQYYEKLMFDIKSIVAADQ